jgi:hypothetical protein
MNLTQNLIQHARKITAWASFIIENTEVAYVCKIMICKEWTTVR